MAKISVALNSTEVATGKKLQKTLTDINAAATSAQIKTFTQALNGLTTNNYVETNRISKLNVDTEEIPGGGEPTGLARNLTYTWIDALQEWQFSFDGQSKPIGYLLVTDNGNVEHLTLTLTYNPQTQKNDYSLSKSSITSSGIVYVTVPAYGEYRAETVSLEVEV